ncbi:MAG: S-methyl-5-thioribose-1-phosphate isomerase [Patescibacteria group bacterium]
MLSKNIQRILFDIKSIKIQGATNVAVATLKALEREAKESTALTRSEFIKQVSIAGKLLANARPTEPMADNAVEFIIFHLNKNKSASVDELKRVVQDATNDFLELMSENETKILRVGEKIVKEGDKVFTHCHSSTVIKLLISAKKNKKRFEVFQTETRPLYQGHRTAKDLLKFGIKDTLLIDSCAPYLISKISGSKFQIDKLIIGCDAISRDGSCVNKVGSFSLASTAFLNKIPVYVVTQALKMNEDAKNIQAIKIEQRSAREVWPNAPRGLKIYNPAFDQVPAEFITGYICEFGIVKPINLFAKVKEQYPWLV